MITLKDGTKKERYVHIDLGKNPKLCFRCKTPIGFFQLKSGWMPMTAQRNSEGNWEIITNRGNYGNYNPPHRCENGKAVQ